MAATERIVAFMNDPDAIKPNPIHSTSVARDFGFRGAFVPVGLELAPRRVELSAADAVEMARREQRESLQCFFAQNPRAHPAWIAGQPNRWLRHSYAVGPSIHATSRIQHAAPVFAGQNFVVSGKCVDAYERRGRHYIVLDVELRGDEGACLVQIRHTSVFHVAKSG